MTSLHSTHTPLSATMTPAQSHPLALLGLMDEDKSVQNFLGIAIRAGFSSTSYRVPAHKLLRALIWYSPAPETIVAEFLEVLERCGGVPLRDLGLVFRL